MSTCPHCLKPASARARYRSSDHWTSCPLFPALHEQEWEEDKHFAIRNAPVLHALEIPDVPKKYRGIKA